MGVPRVKAKRFTNGHGPASSGDEAAAAPLCERAILDAALRLIRRDGGDKLSMRTLASELGVTPMAIYHHVPNKAALVQKLGDSVLEDLPAPAPSGTHWAREFKSYALDGWRRMAAHPGLTELLLKLPSSAVQRRRMRYGASILLAAGFDERAAALTITNFHMYTFGVVSAHARVSKLDAKAPGARRAAKRDASDRMLEYLSRLDFEALLEDGIDTFIAGMRARMQPRATPAPAQRRPRAPGLDGRARGRAPRTRSS
jgi:AcrR family transcriptional regulator